MYTPTQQELEEMGFDQDRFYKDTQSISFNYEDRLCYNEHFYILLDSSCCMCNIYPTSRQDLETLIRMFKPN